MLSKVISKLVNKWHVSLAESDVMPDENALQGVAEFGDKASVSARATSAVELMAHLGNAIQLGQSGKSHASFVATGRGCQLSRGG